ncbi:MAG: glycosyltransferase family 2 protein [Candidatus Omnitrophica bacterium]|nr:glycosyltransferase family 2 protein [Candidatus Omnitrophota bacterium]
MLLTIVITVFNEKDTILEAIREVKDIRLEKEIIVVDNCSTDGTKQLLENLKDPSIEVVFQPENLGYGCSVKTGARLAKGKYLFVQNSDLEYDPSCVYQMVELAEKHGLDAVFGSRLAERKDDSFFEIIKERPYYLATLLSTFLINVFYGRKFTDVIGNRFYRRQVFDEVAVKSNFMAFDFELVSRLCRQGRRIEEIPVKYSPRTYKQGKKIKWHDSFPALFVMLKVKLFG